MRYVRSLLNLAHLAPDIMKRIQNRDIPAGLSLTTLRRGIPLDWAEQRQQFLER